MAKVSIENKELIVKIEGIRKLGTLRNKLMIPLEKVVEAKFDPEAWSNAPRLFQKIAGTDSYGIYFGGSFRQNGKKVFYDLGKKDSAVVIKLKNAKYDRLVIGVSGPEKTAELINNAINCKKNEENELNV